MKNKSSNDNDIYGNYYDNDNQSLYNIESENNNQSLYNIESENNNQIEDFNTNDPKNNTSNKVLRFAMGIAIVIILLWGVYYFIKDRLTPYQIKTNLTSFGLIKTRLKDSNHQLEYLIIPEKKDVPKFMLSNDNIIINEITANITTAKLGETKIDFLNIIDNKTIDSSVNVYIVTNEIPIEDFSTSDITLKSLSKDMITITPTPPNTTQIAFTYYSNDPNIVSVSNNGIIEGKKKGNATITITNKEITKIINVHVE